MLVQCIGFLRELVTYSIAEAKQDSQLYYSGPVQVVQ